jgi:hypothetical protein
MIKSYIGVHVKYSLFLSDCTETWIFSIDFGKILKHQIMKILSVVAESFHVDRRAEGQTDMTNRLMDNIKLSLISILWVLLSKYFYQCIYGFIPV